MICKKPCAQLHQRGLTLHAAVRHAHGCEALCMTVLLGEDCSLLNWRCLLHYLMQSVTKHCVAWYLTELTLPAAVHHAACRNPNSAVIPAMPLDYLRQTLACKWPACAVLVNQFVGSCASHAWPKQIDDSVGKSELIQSLPELSGNGPHTRRRRTAVMTCYTKGAGQQADRCIQRSRRSARQG